MEQVLIAADRDRGEQHRRAETQPQPRAALVRARSEQHAGKEKLELQGQEGRHRIIEARRPGEQRNRHTAARRSEEHTSELQSLMRISYAVFCLKKKKTQTEPLRLATRHINLTDIS